MRTLHVLVFWFAVLGTVLAFSRWVTPLLVQGEPWSTLFDSVASFGIAYAAQVFLSPNRRR